MSVPPELAVLRSRLADAAGVADALAERPVRGARKAAVLILFFADEAGALRLVFIEKSAALRAHAGQLAFPGGKLEPTDASATAGALREAEEEVGVRPSTVEVLGELPSAHIAASGFDVVPVIGWWHAPEPLAPVDVGEVQSVHVLGVADLLDPANRLTWTHAAGFRGPGFAVGELFVWGFTAYLLDATLRLAGWERPWDAKRVAGVPERFLHGRAGDDGQ